MEYLLLLKLPKDMCIVSFMIKDKITLKLLQKELTRLTRKKDRLVKRYELEKIQRNKAIDTFNKTVEDITDINTKITNVQEETLRLAYKINPESMITALGAKSESDSESESESECEHQSF
jgi:hypothetical protein